MTSSTYTYSFEELRGTQLCVATPMYGGMCSGGFANSMLNLGRECLRHGMTMGFFRLSNESLITRARDTCADHFLKQTHEFLMFIDADIEFDAKEVLRMVALMKKNPQYDILAGSAPKKQIHWRNIQKAIEHKIGEENLEDLEYFVGNFVVNFLGEDPSSDVCLDEPLEVKHAGSGFMLIRRSVLEQYKANRPNDYYYHLPENSKEPQKIYVFFECGIDPKSKQYLSEDYMFCERIREMGMKVWICPWVILNHEGSYKFKGGLKNLQKIGADFKAK